MEDIETKVCTKCNETKPTTEFGSRGRHAPHLKRSECKRCRYLAHRQWKQDNPDLVKAHRQSEVWTVAKKCSRRGITEQRLLELYHEQDGKCPICLDDIEIRGSALDHNHTTGEFRGLLCGRCNRSLGMFRDSITILQRAVNYLQERGSYAKE